MKKIIAMLALSIMLVTGIAAVSAQTPGSEMKKSGSEAKKAGTSLGHNVKKGRVVRGGKTFGQHVGRSAKHVGKGVKKAATP